MRKHTFSSVVVIAAAVVFLGAIAPGTAAAPRAHKHQVAHGPRRGPSFADVPSVTFSGYGYGHGRGMGQWGAFGYASEYGWSYQQILAHYYGGTVLGQMPGPEPLVTVHLVELDGHNTIAAALPGGQLSASWGAGDVFVAAAFEVTRSPGAQDVYASEGCSGPWREVGVATGPVTLASALPGSTGSGAPGSSELEACIPGSPERLYQGDLVAQPDGQSDDVLGLEDYVDGVVPSESPAVWSSQGGEAALEAQAVAARSYAMAYLSRAGQICDTQACQMYLGVPDQYGPTADAAVAATAGRALYCVASSTCGPPGSIALTEYSSSTGGYTAGGAFPAVPDLGDAVAANPVHEWTQSVAIAAVEAAFPAVGAFTSVAVTQRNGLGLLGGRAEQVTVTGNAGQVVVPASVFAGAVGLPSDWFQVQGSPSPPTSARAAGPTTIAPATTNTLATTGTAPTTTTMPRATATPLPTTTTMPSAIASPGGTKGPVPVTVPRAAPVTAPLTRHATGAASGYWVVDRRGVVAAIGNATYYGAAAGTALQGQVVGIAATPDDGGYWLAGASGGVLAFGDARWYGSASDVRLRQPIVAISATLDGRGYWLISGDGGVFSYGDAPYYGSLAAFRLGLHVTAFAPTPDGRGYWLATGVGGVFAFGDAGFYGSPASESSGGPGQQSVQALLPSSDGRGYVLVARDGGVFAYGDAPYLGSLPALHDRARVVGSVGACDGAGYYMLSAAGAVYGFGEAPVAAGTHNLSSIASAMTCRRP